MNRLESVKMYEVIPPGSNQNLIEYFITENTYVYRISAWLDDGNLVK